MKTCCWKYLSPRNKLLLSDGSEVSVSDVKAGDNIIGSNEEIRTVLSVIPFKSQNYRIIPRYKSSFILNEYQHLPVSVDGKVFLINLPLFYNYSNRNEMSLLHDEVNFIDKEVSLEPYILGCWLASNTFSRIQFSTRTNQINSILEFITKFNLDFINYGEYVVINDMRIIHLFNKYNLFSSPRIPDDYKFNNRSIRTRIFNGFCDYTDNGLISIMGTNLMNDFCYLAQSLGFFTTIKVIIKNLYVISCTYNNLTVKNDFKVAKVQDTESICLQLNPSNEVGILLSDFTVV